MRKASLLVLLVILWLPSTALAAFNPLGNKVVLDGQNIYRLRSSSSAWQLAQLPTTSSINQVTQFQNRLLVFLEDGTVLTSADGLSFAAAGNLGLTAAPTVVVLAGRLFLLDMANKLSFVTIDGANFTATSQNPAALFDGKSILIEAAGQVNLIDASGSAVQTYQLMGQTWQAPVVATFGLKLVATDSQMVIGIDAADDSLLRLWNNNQWQEFPLGVSVSQVNLAGGRIFLQTNQGVREFDLKTVQLGEPLPLTSLKIIGDEKSGGLILCGEACYFSTLPFSYQQFVTPGSSTNQLTKTPDGWLLWTADSSDLLFTPDFSTFFAVDGGWAKSAKFQAVGIFQNTIFVELLNSSKNLNVYQSTDSLTWKKMTLPNEPTLALTIDQARLKPVGTLVEVTGAQSVLPGAVESDVIYLQDATGGIQIYLSSSKGSLPNRLGYTFTADGKISSSTAKRIVLDSSTDLTPLGSKTTLTWPSRSLDELNQYFGQLVKVQSQVDSTTATSAKLGELKFHFPQASDFFKAGDTIAVTGVVDQTSDGVEVWYDSHDFKLVDTPIVPAPLAVATSSSNTESSSPEKVVTTTIVKTVPIQVLSASQTPAANQSETNTTDSYGLAFLSFVLGALVMRGSRFKALFSGL
ncbi:MAG TPA: hypothetical protein VMQ44_03420 [Candidatus Saccharimonadales bacterium]|nr:hypothetical protein [Candidatus Saccharimonadales bacterium]